MNSKGLPAALFLTILTLTSAWSTTEQVNLLRTPNEGIQPQVVTDARGVVHLIYFKGDPSGGDIFYARGVGSKTLWSKPIRVNSQPGSAVAMGSIRGAQIAVGKAGRVHVLWNGSNKALQKMPPRPNLSEDNPLNNRTPVLYSRLNAAGNGFEEQRNLMRSTVGLDGGGTIAADEFGNVYAAWHGWGFTQTKADETSRKIWVAFSRDEGKTFSPENAVNPEPTGVCGCCGMKAFADKKGEIYILYRAAEKSVNRDEYLLFSKDGGKSFSQSLLDRWKIEGCPMTSAAFTEGTDGVRTAWQSRDQVYYAPINPAAVGFGKRITAPGTGDNRKYPVIAVNSIGQTLMAWMEGTAWAKGGTLVWQLFDKTGKPVGKQGRVENVPVWSFAAVFARSGEKFTIIH